MDTSFDASTLREQFLSQVQAASGSRVVTVQGLLPGQFSTQAGCFDVDLDSMSISICVWEGGIVELHSQSATGEVHEIETLHGYSRQSVCVAMWKHIARYAQDADAKCGTSDRTNR